MKLEGEYVFEAPVADVWSALFDPAVLAAVMPGCRKLELVDGKYVGDLDIKVGPVQGKLSGKVELKDVDEPRAYTMVIDGRGAFGFAKATVAVTLDPKGDRTRLHYDADAQVGGKLASVGQRLVEASARAISKQSLEGLNENIKIRAAAAAEARAAAKEEAAEEAEEQAGEEAIVSATGAAEPSASTPEPPAPAAATPREEIGSGSGNEEQAPEEAGEAPEAELPAPKKPRAKRRAPAPAPPPPVLKTVDQKALAASIAREVTRSLIPPEAMMVVALVIVALVLWLAFKTAG